MNLLPDAPFTRRSVLLMGASVVLFAINTLLIRAISLHSPVATCWMAVLFRGGVGLIVVYACYSGGRGLRLKRLFSSRLVLIRGIVGALSIVAFYVTVVKLGAGRAVALNLTYPIFATLIAALWLKEKPRRAAWLWMGVGFLGLPIFLSKNGRAVEFSTYDAIALIGALGAGWVVVIIRRLRHQEHPATIYASQALFSLLLATPAASHLNALPGWAWCGLIAGALVVTVAQLAMTEAYRSMPVSAGSSLQMTLPVITAIGGYFCFGETFHAVEIGGAALTLFATWRVVAAH